MCAAMMRKAVVLTRKQQHELDRSVLAYLGERGLEKTRAVLLQELLAQDGSSEGDAAATAAIEKDSGRLSGMLVAKWRSILRLQKRIMQLEASNSQLLEEAEALARGATGGVKRNVTEALPRAGGAPPQHVLDGHRGGITAVAFHPIFSLLFSASEDASIKVWDWERGSFERSLSGHSDAVRDIAFGIVHDMVGSSSLGGGGAHSGATTTQAVLASCSSDLTVKLWNGDGDFECIKTLMGHEHSVSGVTFIPIAGSHHDNGRMVPSSLLASCSRDGTIKVWEISTGYCLRTLRTRSSGGSWIRSVSAAPDGLHLASGGMDHGIIVWDQKSGLLKRELRGHDHVIECISWSNSDIADANVFDMILSEQTLPEIHVSEIKTHMAARQRRLEMQKKSGNGLAAAGRSGSGQVAAPGASAGGGGAFLLSGSRDRMLRIWHAETGICVKVLCGHENWVRGALWHPSGKFIMSCGDDKMIRIWDLTRHGRQVRSIDNAHPLFVSCLAYNVGFPVCASGGVDNRIHVWKCQ